MSTKPGHTATAVTPAAQPSDITTRAESSTQPAPSASDIRVEYVPQLVDEVAMEQAFESYRKFVRELGSDLHRRWDGMPEQFRPPRYVFYRCGTRNQPRALFVRGELLKAGWVDAPKGTTCAAYLSDRGEGVYVMTRADLYRRYTELENELAREKAERALRSKKSANFDRLREQGIEIESVDERRETMTAEEFMGGRGGVVRK